MNDTPALLYRSLLALALSVVTLTVDAAEPFWRQVMPRKKVQADASADYNLTENNGPWLIMAASFTGELGEQEARALVQEVHGDTRARSGQRMRQCDRAAVHVRLLSIEPQVLRDCAELRRDAPQSVSR